MPGDASRDSFLRRRVLRGALSNYVGQFVTLATGFLLTPFVLHQLGATGYGLSVLVGSVVAYGMLFDFGIWGAVIKYVSEYRARGEIAQARSFVATALTLHTLLGLTAIALSAVIAPIFPDVFNVPPADRATAVRLVLLSGLGIGVAIPCTTSAAVLHGLHRFDLGNVISAVGTFLTGVATVIVLLLGGGVLGMVAVAAPITVLMQVPSVWLVNRIAPELKFGWRGARRSLVRKIISFGSPLFVMQVAGRLETRTDEIVIGAFLPVSTIAPYAVARRLSAWASLLTQQFVRVLLPLASELQAHTDWVRLRAVYLTGTRVTLAIFLPIGCTLAVLARPILTAWVGPVYADSAPLVAILTLAGLADVSQWTASTILQGMARHRVLAAMSACSAVANLALSIALVKGLGVTGVALGTLIPTTAVSLGLVMPYVMRVIGIRPAEVLRTSVLPALLPAVPMAIALLALQQVVDLSSIVSLIAVAGVGVLVYVVGYLVLGASESERRTYRGFALDVVTTILKRLRPAM